MDGGCQGLGKGTGRERLMGMEIQFCKMKRVPETDGGDGRYRITHLKTA